MYAERLDLVGRAIAREREARRVIEPSARQAAMARVFNCVCCGRERRDEARREPRSEVCVRCAQLAGFEE
jgi:hypothetical protein